MKRYPVGLPQELVLSPVLFYMFINALQKEMNSLRIKFTDDTKLLFFVNMTQDRDIRKREGREDRNEKSL